MSLLLLFNQPSGATVSVTVQSQSAGSVTFALVGVGTAWAGSPFSLVGGAPAVLSAQAVTDATHATITITQNGNLGPYTISDGARTFQAAIPSAGIRGLIIETVPAY